MAKPPKLFPASSTIELRAYLKEKSLISEKLEWTFNIENFQVTKPNITDPNNIVLC